MATTTIPWGDGSGDNLYLTYPSASGDQSVSVTSDANTGAARSKVVTFSASGVPSVTLTINQASGTPQEVTITLHPTSYDQNDKSYYNFTNPSNGYADSDSGNYATISATRGSNAESWLYYLFDTSSIPAGATILEVSCTCKCSTNGNNTALPTREIQMSSGTTLKGSASNLNSGTTIKNMTIGTWTLAELRDARIKIHMIRGTSNVDTNYYARFYGATLTIKYQI